mmetsp:Transcript_1191/g.3428  ORF Transcript_1191/g.3428 Transcript_1191/m.3428 type:complete len:268 (-) Transcript_1191:49-852(-)
MPALLLGELLRHIHARPAGLSRMRHFKHLARPIPRSLRLLALPLHLCARLTQLRLEPPRELGALGRPRFRCRSGLPLPCALRLIAATATLGAHLRDLLLEHVALVLGAQLLGLGLGGALLGDAHLTRCALPLRAKQRVGAACLRLGLLRRPLGLHERALGLLGALGGLQQRGVGGHKLRRAPLRARLRLAKGSLQRGHARRSGRPSECFLLERSVLLPQPVALRAQARDERAPLAALLPQPHHLLHQAIRARAVIAGRARRRQRARR